MPLTHRTFELSKHFCVYSSSSSNIYCNN
jgi:hypothetical protein